MQVDIAIVGSGLCGTLAARLCAQRGKRVVVLEAGPPLAPELPRDLPSFQKATAPALQVDPRRWAFRSPKGYQWYRVRARGGRTLLWGGWMARPASDYFEARRRADAAWPPQLEQLGPWVRRAEQALHVRSARPTRLHHRLQALGYEANAKRESMLSPRARPLTAADLELDAVRTRAVVLRVEPRKVGLALHLARGAPVTAKRVILAASPVETARIVSASGVGGRRFSLADHLIAGAIAICDRAPPEEETSALIYPSSERLRYAVEVRGPKPLEQLDDDDLAQLGFTREQAKQRSFYVVFAMGETDPHLPRRVELTAALDALGRRVPRFLARRHTPHECALAARMNETCLVLARSLAAAPEHAFPIYDANDFTSGGHEVGTCVGLLDALGELKDLPGVFVADGSGVPGATDRHPSLLLAANALRVGQAASSAR